VASQVLISNMWSYAASVLYPAVALKEIGLYHSTRIGVPPPPPAVLGLGPHYSHSNPFPVLLETRPEHYDLVAEFDNISRDYERFVKPFSAPIFEETLKVMRQYLTPSSRVLDTSCGPGTEATSLATLVPEGEVVAADLAAEMVQTTFGQARRAGIGNMAFFQADVGRLSDYFEEMFDATFCSLAFHHYPDPASAVSEKYRVLRPGGYAFVADPGPEWFKLISTWIASWADPGWIGWHSGEEFRTLFLSTGFAHYYWEELLPGIGLVVAMK
jgi:ubiquinone/menaquinone biosynthesis C-methylase UbiE